MLLRVEAGDGIDARRVTEEIYDACDEVPFGFDVERVDSKLTTLAEVDRLAEQLHAGQMDKGGVPYVEHVRAVAAGLTPFSPQLQMAGLLHNVIEDTDWTAEMLRQAGVEGRVVRLVELVSRVPGEDYMDRVREIAADPQATLLKISDNAHNSREDRAIKLPDKNRTRLDRYRKARQILWPMAEKHEIEEILKIVNPGLLPELHSFKTASELAGVDGNG